MSSFHLKIIASICMLLDHIGAVFPENSPIFFRILGRISFPIYVYLIVQGCTYSKNINKYMLRLGIFAIISEIPFDLAFNNSKFIYTNFIDSTNVFYSLFLGVACISIYEKLKFKSHKALSNIVLVVLPTLILISVYTSQIISIASMLIYTFAVIILSIYLPNISEHDTMKFDHKLLTVLSVSPLILLGDLLNSDYGSLGIALIFVMYLAGSKVQQLKVLLIGIFAIYGMFLYAFFTSQNIYYLMYFIVALLSIAIIYLYNGKQGLKLKWLFYLFYPAHLTVLALINII